MADISSDQARVPLTPSETRALLERLGHRPRKQLGQNFLIDGNIVRKSIELAELGTGEPVVEVGPGLGTLTGALLSAGARIWAVEYDGRLAGHLRNQFGDRINLLEGDAVDFPLAGYPVSAVSGESFKIVSNLPYAVTTPWIEGVLRGLLPSRMVLMMQKEAADRLLARVGTKHFGAVSIFLQSAYREGPRHPVSASCFYPQPQVGSVLVSLILKSAPVRFDSELRKAIRQIFTLRRKQMSSLVRNQPLLQEWWSQLQDRNLVSAQARPEEIPLDCWQLLVG